MAGLTVLSCIAIITFSFALYYARKDVEEGGLEFTGPEESVFSDYVYLAAGCSVTFGTTDTIVTSARRCDGSSPSRACWPGSSTPW